VSALVAALLGVALPALRIVPLLWLASRALAPLRAGLLVAVALALAVGLRAGGGSVAVDAWLLVAALRELAVGAVLAVVLGAPLVALSTAGAWIDRPWATADGPFARLLGLVGAATLLAAGAHRGVLRALAASYAAMPVGGRGPIAAGAWAAALSAAAAALSAAATLAASALLAVVALEVTVALAGRVGRPWERAELQAPLREVATLGVVALTLGAFTGATRALAQSALDAVTALR
jgi:type III secretory pathway component EscT